MTLSISADEPCLIILICKHSFQTMSGREFIQISCCQNTTIIVHIIYPGEHTVNSVLSVKKVNNNAADRINRGIEVYSVHKWKLLSSTTPHSFYYLSINFLVFFRVKHGDASVLWIIDEYQSYDLPSTTQLIAEDPSGPEGPRLVFRLIEVMTSRYNHSNGHQPDSRPANGICMPCPDTRLTLHAGNYYT